MLTFAAFPQKGVEIYGAKDTTIDRIDVAGRFL